MKPLLLSLLLTLAISSFAEGDATSLFNGEDLTGWDGDPKPAESLALKGSGSAPPAQAGLLEKEFAQVSIERA
jgi:hypothetical protein